MAKSKDLFDDQTMTFGEHLDSLRTHLIKAILGLIICVIGALFYGDSIVAIVRGPIDAALKEHGRDDVQDDLKANALSAWWDSLWSDDDSKDGDKSGEPDAKAEPKGTPKNAADTKPNSDGDDSKSDAETKNASKKMTAEEIRARQTITVELNATELANALHEYDDRFPGAKEVKDEKPFKLNITAPEFSQLKNVVERQNQAITLTVQEAFLTYLKVAFVAGLAISSPWVFYQIWLFVAAGLYPHERRYVYIYLPISILLFAVGAVFCFLAVFPFVLDFLLSFNKMLDVQPQIRLSEWISFAIMLPLMFGLSFQLPLVMLFLERISIFEVSGYREKRRMAVLVIAFLSMMLTPADPMSMLLMMFPLMLLYELGILMCAMKPSKVGFPDEPQSA
jgi:sec-independent protein translocase protein TatC